MYNFQKYWKPGLSLLRSFNVPNQMIALQWLLAKTSLLKIFDLNFRSTDEEYSYNSISDLPDLVSTKLYCE